MLTHECRGKDVLSNHWSPLYEAGEKQPWLKISVTNNYFNSCCRRRNERLLFQPMSWLLNYCQIPPSDEELAIRVCGTYSGLLVRGVGSCFKSTNELHATVYCQTITSPNDSSNFSKGNCSSYYPLYICTTQDGMKNCSLTDLSGDRLGWMNCLSERFSPSSCLRGRRTKCGRATSYPSKNTWNF